jgi:hypothetical protein
MDLPVDDNYIKDGLTKMLHEKWHNNDRDMVMLYVKGVSVQARALLEGGN